MDEANEILERYRSIMSGGFTPSFPNVGGVVISALLPVSLIVCIIREFYPRDPSSPLVTEFIFRHHDERIPGRSL